MRYKALLLTGLIFFMVSGANIAAAQCVLTRIMPLGDSITAGVYGAAETRTAPYYTGYRLPLYQSLTGAGYSVDFVGSQSYGSAIPGSDYNNEGNPGYTPTDIANVVYDRLAANPPDVVLLHIGTNGLSTDPSQVETILNEIDRFDPNIVVVLARIINSSPNDPTITQFNDDVVAMANNRIANGDRIVIVDMESALNYSTDMSDTLHPNATGYGKMANVWFAALQTIIPTCAQVAPVINSVAGTTGSVNLLYQYDVNAISIPAANYRLAGTPPSGMTINQYTGLITWTPTATGTYSVAVEAYNGYGSGFQTYTINVASTVYTIWSPNVTVGTDAGSSSPVELGVKFRSDANGYIIGIRYYKYAGNTGTHTGSLWTRTGTRLGQATFTNETSSGWQQASFAAPVPVTANTTYVASYFTTTGHFAYSSGYFSSAGVDNPPLHALKSGVDGSNAVYAFGSTSVFPNASYLKSNYWVDVIFASVALHHFTFDAIATPQYTGNAFSATIRARDAAEGSYTGYSGTVNLTVSNGTITPTAVTLTNGVWTGQVTITGLATGATITATAGTVTGTSNAFDVVSAAPKITSTAVVTGQVNTAYQYDVNATGNPAPTYQFVNSQPAGMTMNGTSGLITWTPTTVGTYTVTVKAVNINGSDSQTFTISVGAMSTRYSIWSPGVSVGADIGALSPVELGVKFRSDVAGTITGIRYYRYSGNTGTHTGSLWTVSGTRLGQATFTNETASGWQEASFATPIPVTANTTYIASYFTTTGHSAFSASYFSSAGLDNPPLHALQSGVDGLNGLYIFSSTSAFPNQTYQDSNYWVDVAFSYNSALHHFTFDTISTQYPNTAFAATIRAKDGAGNAYTNFNGTVNLTVSSGTITPNAVSMTNGVWTGPVTIAGLAAGVTITATAGTVTGTSNAFDVVSAAPKITSTAVLTGQVNTAYQYDVSATGNPAPTFQFVNSPPAGMTINGTSGLIDWTPTAAGTYTVTVKAVNTQGNDSQTFAINVSATYSIWNPGVAVGADPGGTSPIEVGVKFRSDVNGLITGLRFYKHPLNIGTHTGSLWTAGGVRLGQVTFTNETASGWQEASFAAPIPITANTTYVASYFTSVGHYAFDLSYFVANGVDTPPLHALKSGVDGYNGVFRFSSTSVFPDQFIEAIYANSNFWVDVTFR